MSERTPGNEVHGEDAAVPVIVERLADWLCLHGWGMRLTDPELAEEVRNDWRDDARKMAADLGIEEVGIDYCLTHLGTRNEDEAGACDWRMKSDDKDSPCALVPLVVFGSYRASESGLGEDAGGPFRSKEHE